MKTTFVTALLLAICTSGYAQPYQPKNILFDHNITARDPIPFVPVANKLVFMAKDKDYNFEAALFYYDGQNPAVRVPQNLMGNIAWLNGMHQTPFYNKVYFNANVNGKNTLYNWDGTNVVKQVYNKGFATRLVSAPLPKFGDSLYYIATDHLSYTLNKGGQLVILDTKNELVIPALDTSYHIGGLIRYDNKVYFTKNNLASELYSYDPATKAVQKINTGFTNPNITIQSMNVVQNKLLITIFPVFASAPTLYEYDGSSLKMLDDYQSRFNDLEYASGPYIYNNNLYFSFNNRVDDTFHLIKYDPINYSYSKVYTFNYTGPQKYAITRLSVAFGRLYFTAKEDIIGTQLFEYDDRTGRVVQMTDYGTTISEKENFNPLSVFPWKDQIYFTAYYGYYSYPDKTQMYRLKPDLTGLKNTSALIKNHLLYPNPTRENTTLLLTILEDDYLTVSISDMLGRRVYIDKHKYYKTGKQSITLTTNKLSAGNYIYNVSSTSGKVIAVGRLTKQ